MIYRGKVRNGVVVEARPDLDLVNELRDETP
jgi:hypothetical protein